MSGWTASDKFLGAIGAGVIGLVCAVVYIAALWAMRSPELRPAVELLRRRLRRSSE